MYSIINKRRYINVNRSVNIFCITVNNCPQPLFLCYDENYLFTLFVNEEL